ncbi:MAG: hemolysin family protein [Acidobacteriota bacterium]|nr:hemolysin family protein [Acidobacteriota bacterium]
MGGVAFEVLFIFLLLIANGVFAMSEIAVVSSRKARLQQRAETGDAKARAALALAVTPDKFLSTVQIGITLVGIFAGAFGGATLSEKLAAQLALVPVLAPYSRPLALVVVVAAITYLSLIIGELVPKRIALNNPEGIAAMIARPMNLLSKVAAPFVYLLSISTAAVMKLLPFKEMQEALVSEEEIKVLIEQGTKAGIFEETEQALVESVLRLADRSVSALMTPRLDIVALDLNDAPDVTRERIVHSHYSRFPVCRGGLDNLVGVVKAKDLLARTVAGETLDLETAMKAPLYVPESRTALQTLEMFKGAHTHLAFVIDEYGAIEGLVTTNDVLEAIVGDITLAGPQAETYAVKREDGSWLLDGALPIDEFKDIFKVGEMPGEMRGAYQTLAGFIIKHLGRIPAAADHFEWGGLRFEVMDMDRNRVDKVLVTSTPLEHQGK